MPPCGGVWERAAGYTPTAMVAEFQHGLIRLDVVLVAAALVFAGLGLAAIWLRLGVAVRRRVNESIALGAAAAAVMFACTFFTASWDMSESRGNSFAEADEETLKAIRTPLRIEAHLAPEDPRRADLEHRAFVKLRRAMPKTQVHYVSSSTIGLFEQTAPHYGEIWYELGGRRTMSRVTTAEGVLEAIYGLPASAAGRRRGEYLSRASARGPAERRRAVFYGIWPAAIVATAFLVRRRSMSSIAPGATKLHGQLFCTGDRAFVLLGSLHAAELKSIS